MHTYTHAPQLLGKEESHFEGFEYLETAIYAKHIFLEESQKQSVKCKDQKVSLMVFCLLQSIWETEQKAVIPESIDQWKANSVITVCCM